MDEKIEQVSVKKSKKIVFLIWLLPFIALLISTSMLYNHFEKQGEEIEIYFNNAEGFVVDKTPLKYKGIKIGIVSNIEVDEKNINRFLVKVEVDNKALSLVAKKGTKFWKVEPKATLTEISGLNTIFSGIYIEAMPSAQNIEEIKKLEEQYTFNAVSEKPINYLQDGLFIDLKSSNGTLEVGAPVLYKSFLVGKIVKKNLKDNNVLYTIFIEEEYKSLVKEDSSFWNVNAIDLKASLSGIKFKVNTLASLIAGGIAFDSDSLKEPLVNTSKVFNLYSSKEDIDYLPDYVVLETDVEHGLEKDFSKVLYNGIEIGYVDDLSFVLEDKQSFIFVKIKKEFASLLKSNPYFELKKPTISLEKLEELPNIVKGTYISLTKRSKNEGEIKDIYTLHNNPMKREILEIVLKSDDTLKIEKDSPVFFKDIKVGRVKSKKLHSKSDELRVNVEIFKEYSYLVNSTSIFYIQSPVEINASLENISFKTAPLSGFINSSIAFDTKDLSAKRTINRFYLFPSYEKMLEQKYFLQKGKRYTLSLDNANNVLKSNSIYYKGIEAGKVVSKKYNEKTKKVDAQIFVFEKYAKYINESTKFYSISGFDMDFSLEKVNIKTQSLNTLVKGGISFISLDENAKKVKSFHKFDFYKSLDEVLKEQRFNENGLRVVVLAKSKSSLKENSPVFYRQLQIGVVEDYSLAKDGTSIELQLYIDEKFKYLVRKNSIFYNATAFGMEVSLLGVKVTTETLETLISGGISLVTPTEYKEQADSMMSFPLYNDVEEEWLNWNPKFEKL
ncbi:hypothetical protein CRV01_09920 [Arcobacter sp. CECT 8983]|uniref:MlaD family protein n=1 Tax=Arcobacter sp. CECT 8983 TaxID=2044508 RepID=UPI00100BB687|nr:MlaD family protein [Arcobacter sp. CECT 8983]RXJ88928.1 hypothetical protein CRV01_09920 [Arcobacter sp. CECT 8983]